jgi:hypothetical protein
MHRVRHIEFRNTAPPMASLKFQCPGCNCEHSVWTQGQGVPLWGWNGSLDKPTITPSILRHGPQRDAFGNYTGGSEAVCHSFVIDGRIQFCDDSTHPLKGQTVELPEYEDVHG